MDARDLGARVRAASPARPRGAADPPRFFASPSRGSEGPGARATLAAGIAAHLAPARAAAPLGGSAPAATPPPTPTSLGLPPLTPPPLPASAFATHAAPAPENVENPPAPAPAPAPAPPEGTRFVAAHTHFDRLFASLPRPALRALLEGHASSSAPPWGERRPGSAPFPPPDPDEKDENDERAKKSNPRAAPPALPPRPLPGDLAPAPPPRHRLAEMKKAAKAVRSRDALLALLEAGTSLSDAVPRKKKEPPLRKPPRYLFPSLDDDDAKRAATDANDDGSARPRPGGGAKRTLGVGRRASEDASSGSEDDEDLSAPPPTLRDSGSETNAESESSEDSEEASTLRRTLATPKKTPPPLPPLRRPLTLLGTRPGVGARPRRLNESATAAAAMADDAAAARAAAARGGGGAGGPDSRGGVAADDPPSPRRALPFVAGAVVIVALGEIDLARSARASSSSSYVLPVGFVSRRRYNSAVAPGERTWYESSVHRDTDISGGADEGQGEPSGGADDGQNAAAEKHGLGQHREESGQQRKKEGVLVRVRDVGASGGAVPGELRDERIFTGPSPTHAWQQAIRAVNEVNQTRKRAAVSGPQFMGLSSPVVAQEIAKLPGYKECREAMRAEERAKSANKRRKKKKEALFFLSKGELEKEKEKGG